MVESNKHTNDIKFLELSDFLKMELPPLQFIVEPWLTKQNIVMIYAERGLGKTYFSMSLALAIITGNSYLDWVIPNPQNVLYVDGEMSMVLLQQRFNQLLKHDLTNAKKLMIANYEHLQDHHGLLNLSDIKRQEDFLKLIPKDCGVIFFDNISCLFSGIDENDSQAWHPIQCWMIRLKSLGYTVIMIHHSNKSGGQRGTSKREDCLDVVIKLCPQQSTDSNGAQFLVDFTKTRSFTIDTAKPIAASLCSVTNIWSHSYIDKADDQKIIDLYNEGNNQPSIVKKTGISQSTISRKLAALKAQGIIT